ncbi:MAG TPA: MoxR family ATPase [Candidatus Faecivicinus avistercoris]|nr:MoxR family ATPase [Candidatus Faecivicinus avistercoris]
MEGLNEIRRRMAEESYIADDALAVTLLIALKLGRPLLIEGAAGVGKTEVAKVAAKALGRELVRMQCYEGLDESKALYEWNYQKQLLAIQMGAQGMSDLFGEDYLLERPLLKSIRSAEPVVLLIDEIDKADAEFEAFLLELLSEMQVTIPEYGTIRAKSTPFIVLTSNHTRPLSEALRRRCAYMYLEYPDVEREVRILQSKLPGLDAVLAKQVARAVAYLRQSERVLKKPSIAESLDWASALIALGAAELDDETCEQTIGFALKNHEDIKEIMADDEFIRCLVQ